MTAASKPVNEWWMIWMMWLVHVCIDINGLELKDMQQDHAHVSAHSSVPIETETTSKGPDSHPAFFLSALICVLEQQGPSVAFLLFLFCSLTTYNLNWWFWRVLCKNCCSANILSLVLRHLFKIWCCLLHSLLFQKMEIL